MSGIALNLLALGTSSVLFATLFEGSSGGRVTGLPEVHVPLLDYVPFLGPVLFQQRAVTIVRPMIAGAVALVLARSRTGLRLRAAGHDAVSAMLEGVRVRRTRLWSNVCAGVLAGIGGAFLTLRIANQFSDEIIAGGGDP